MAVSNVAEYRFPGQTKSADDDCGQYRRLACNKECATIRYSHAAQSPWPPLPVMPLPAPNAAVTTHSHHAPVAAHKSVTESIVGGRAEVVGQPLSLVPECSLYRPASPCQSCSAGPVGVTAADYAATRLQLTRLCRPLHCADSIYTVSVALLS
jgi:hypothetical protein